MHSWFRRVAGLVAMGSLVSVSAQTTVTWSGLGADANFTTPENWVGGVAPAAGDSLVFPAALVQTLAVNAPVTVGSITFSGIRNGYYLNGTGALTLNGDITTTAVPVSENWGVIQVPVALSAGMHQLTTGNNAGVGANLYFSGPISGPGGLTKNGGRALDLWGANSNSGGTVINAGDVNIASGYAFGSGPVTFNGGRLAAIGLSTGSLEVSNDFTLGSAVTFQGFAYAGQPEIILYGNITAAAGVSTVTITHEGGDYLHMDGTISNGSGATTYAFAGGQFQLSGANTYTGGTVVQPGASVIFFTASSVPASGTIAGAPDTYVGLGDPTLDAATFSQHFDLSTFEGTIGFDYYNTFDGNINLSDFGHDVAIGTRTYAKLTGDITPHGNTYSFRSSGYLILQGGAPFSGSRDLVVRSFDQAPPGYLVLSHSGTESYAGLTTVDGAALIFDHTGAISPGTSFQVMNAGYLGITGTAEGSLADLVALASGVSLGAVGFDSHDYLYRIDYTPVTYAQPLDFSSLTQPVYLGSATDTTYTSTITTTNDGTDDYYLTGFGGGTLRLTSALTGTKALHVGLPGIFQEFNNGQAYAIVELTNPGNTFSGGTEINSGYLRLTDPAAAGTGPITANPMTSDGTVIFEAPSNSTLTNALILQSGTLKLAGNYLTVTGAISGPGHLEVRDRITFAGDNTFSGGITVDGLDLTLASASPLGTGPVELLRGASLRLTNTGVTLGALTGGEPYEGDGIAYSGVYFNAVGGSSTLTVNQNSNSVFYGAILDGTTSGALVKTGTGTLTLYGERDPYDTPYSGGTTITEGTLVAGSSEALGTGPITINGGRLSTLPNVSVTNSLSFGSSGGTLGGNGIIITSVTVGPNAILAPGDSPGLLTFATDLMLASGGQLEFQVQSATGGAGTGYDLVRVSIGELAVASTSAAPFTIKLVSLNAGGAAGDVADFASANSYRWMLFEGNAAGGIFGYAPDKFALDTSAFTNSTDQGFFSFSTGYNGANPAIYLEFTAVPEPSVYALLAAGLGLAALARRRRG